MVQFWVYLNQHFLKTWRNDKNIRHSSSALHWSAFWFVIIKTTTTPLCCCNLHLLGKIPVSDASVYGVIEIPKKALFLNMLVVITAVSFMRMRVRNSTANVDPTTPQIPKDICPWINHLYNPKTENQHTHLWRKKFQMPSIVKHQNII